MILNLCVKLDIRNFHGKRWGGGRFRGGLAVFYRFFSFHFAGLD